jgi:hypothetical protein
VSLPEDSNNRIEMLPSASRYGLIDNGGLVHINKIFLSVALSLWTPVFAQKTPTAAPSDAWGTKIIQLKYADPQELREIFSGQSYVMDANRDLKLLTAHGPAAFLKEVEDTVKRFDVAPPLPVNVQITVYLLAAAEQASSPGTLPPELSALSKELKAVGGSQPIRLADCQMVRMRADEPGEATGFAPPSPLTASLSRVRIESAYINPTKGDLISLDGLRVWLNVPPNPSPDISRPQPLKRDWDISANIDVVQNQAVIVTQTGIEKPLFIIVRANIVH